MLKVKGINAHLRERITEIYKETKNVVSSAEKETGTFWTEKGVRHGCPLSPTLFNLYISDLNEEISKVREGGIVIDRYKIWTQIYADDVILVASGQKELEAMISRFVRYIKRKKGVGE